MSLLKAASYAFSGCRTSKCVNINCSFLQRQSPTRGVALLPDKTKHTLIEKWRRYWDDLIKDYKDVLKDTVQNGKENPTKTFVLFSSLSFIFMCYKTNPDYVSYREKVINCSNCVLIVPKAIRNQRVEQFLTSIETCFNFGLIHRLSFGVFSVIWIDNFNKELGLFKTNCSYLKPQYLSFSNRVVDVGFFGKWWRLDLLMKDYDVNGEEWIHEAKT